MRLPAIDHPEYKSMERGMKITSAFEMLHARNPTYVDEPACFRTSPPQCEGERRGGAEAKGQSHAGGRKGWEKFEACLQRCGYYRGEMQGSRVYRELRGKAEDHFDQLARGGPEWAVGLAEVMDRLARDKGVGEGAMWRQGEDVEDDDSWLDVEPGDLDEMLRGRTSGAGGAVGVDMGEGMDMLNEMVGKMGNFVGAF